MDCFAIWPRHSEDATTPGSTSDAMSFALVTMLRPVCWCRCRCGGRCRSGCPTLCHDGVAGCFPHVPAGAGAFHGVRIEMAMVRRQSDAGNVMISIDEVGVLRGGIMKKLAQSCVGAKNRCTKLYVGIGYQNNS